jgi:hypothetical protein
MRDYHRLLWLGTGLILGLIGAGLYLMPSQRALASSNDRFEDYIMCTGAVGVTPRAPTDGLWLLDYRKGKLLGTVIDRVQGKIIGWAELDLVKEFGVQPKQDVHFMMLTGNIANGQAALYLAEMNSGVLGVYTLGQAMTGQNIGFAIYRHDLSSFRGGAVPNVQPQGPQVGLPAGFGGIEGQQPRANLQPFIGPQAKK